MIDYQGDCGHVEGVAAASNLLHGAQEAQALLAIYAIDLVDVFGVLGSDALGGQPHAIAEVDHGGRIVLEQLSGAPSSRFQWFESRQFATREPDGSGRQSGDEGIEMAGTSSCS